MDHAEVCAYRLPDEKFALCQDYSDDKEYGTGKTLVQLPVNRDEMNKAVFMIWR